ncbi:MAG TPA: DUF2589 domain-containing protein [Allosphingosinicella sp.]|nr:DUF2589 domain-containing protein [Allosphingosinicella sp.]
MSLDTSAGQVALGQLQSLPFENIIGGPLVAAINGQALAAESTIDFIEAIGLQGPPGQLEAINVKFSYMDGSGAVRMLSVPILTIIPIPFIVIDTIDIQFKARIAASAQQASEQSSSSGGGISGGGTASWRRKRFRAAVHLDASYSAKKDSKSSQDSRYAVEYTVDVHVHASQAGLPQGMAQILNILQDGISNAPPTGPAIQIFGLRSAIVASPGNSPAFTETCHVIVTDEPNDLPSGYTISATTDQPALVTAAPAPPPTGTPAPAPATVTMSSTPALTPQALGFDLVLTITATPPLGSGKPPLTTVRTVRIEKP